MNKLKLVVSFVIAVVASSGMFISYGTAECAVWVLAWAGWMNVFFNEIDKTK